MPLSDVYFPQVSTTSPQFNTYYHSTKQSITAVLALMRLNVNEETLPRLVNIFQNMGDDIR